MLCAGGDGFASPAENISAPLLYKFNEIRSIHNLRIHLIFFV